MLEIMKSKVAKIAAAASGLLMSGAVFAQEAAQIDYSSLVTKVTTEVTSAVTSALPVGGLVLAIYIGWRIFKRFAKG